MSQHARRPAVSSDKRPSRWPRQLAPASEQALQPLAPGAILHRAALAPEPLRPAEVVRLQQTLGNRAVGGLLNRSSSPHPRVQAKLAVNAPGDQYEQEADRAAEQVMRLPAERRNEHEGAGAPAAETAPLRFGGPSSSRGRGRALGPALRAEFESALGADFGDVRIHTGDQAAQLSRELQAELTIKFKLE